MAKKSKQPNILVIWGDDIGQSNLSCYTHGLKRTARTGQPPVGAAGRSIIAGARKEEP